MANKTLKMGDRVRLSPDTRWDMNATNKGCKINPLDCLGTVVDIDSYGDLTVRWDNEAENFYEACDDDLILMINSTAPLTLDNIKW